jgi:hypothetical protein
VLIITFLFIIVSPFSLLFVPLAKSARVFRSF